MVMVILFAFHTKRQLQHQRCLLATRAPPYSHIYKGDLFSWFPFDCKNGNTCYDVILTKLKLYTVVCSLSLGSVALAFDLLTLKLHGE